ncbi:peptidase inhibitor family I36 protein [Streptomyces sp. CT34]|uniref:peptidase inhibitor family I36 protein n=1 Tax=Streptomyces sp. CT34 TaxID=1553907 RepID=UPI0005BB8ABF|nr:peptidase inhibitor family I36 protein [Streptomyces sp. CT34]
MRIHHVTAALGSLAAAAALALATTIPAHARTGAASDAQARAAAVCPQGFACFWPEPDFGGEMRTAQNPDHDCRATPVQPARSVYNHSSDALTFFSRSRCSVRVGALESGGYAQSVNVSSWQ